MKCAVQEEQVRVLIVESDHGLGKLWKCHLERQGMHVRLEQDQTGALTAMQEGPFDVVILNLLLERSNAFAIADSVAEQDPGIPVLFVTNTSFFSDGSIFGLCANARAFLNADTAPEDLSAMVEYYARSA